MMGEIQLFDVVALREAMPEHGLRVGQVGTVVEALSEQVLEVEFADLEGRTHASDAIPAEVLMVLHYEPAAAD